MKLRGTMPHREWFAMLERLNYKDPNWRKPGGRPVATVSGQLRAVSLAVGALEHVLTVKELVDNIIHGAEELLDSYEFIKAS